MGKKLCELCDINPAEVPDRERMGRPINRICNPCHAARLRGDLEHILKVREEKRKRIMEGEAKEKRKMELSKEE